MTGAQPAGPAVEAVEEVARAIAIAALPDDLVEQRPGLLVVVGGEGVLRLLQPRGQHALRLDGGRARLLEAAPRFDIVGIEEKDAAEDIGGLTPPVPAQEVATFVEESPEAVPLDTRQIA